VTACRAVCVDPAKVSLFWPHVENLIRTAMKKGGLGSFEVVKRETLAGRNLLWIAWDEKVIQSAVITAIDQTEWHKSLTIVACGGAEMDQWLPLMADIDAHARAEGCSRILIFGRRGWENVLTNFRPYRVVLERLI
jgi:hypothetical protein